MDTKKERKTRLQDPENFGQSSSIGAVRWKLPDEDLKMHSSAPTKSSTSNQKDLKDLRGLQECVQFIRSWKQEVEHVCKDQNSRKASGSKIDQKDQLSSLEQSRKLILRWAEELKAVDSLFSNVSEGKKEKQSNKTETEQKIVEWARELQSVTKMCGLVRVELLLALRQLHLKKKPMLTILPFLEFITWSLLKEGNDTVSQMWLATKQRTWKTETPKYIPNSVWDWIRSASVDVTLDTMTNHPWLIVSDDRKKVQEAHAETQVSYSTQRYDGWPCVLGWEGMASGRHYWEVKLANNGYWRVGLTTASSKRQGRFTMCPQDGYWALWRSTRQFYACTKPETQLPLEMVPTNLGIYLDYDEGQISFYNVETRSHIYTFRGSFREKLYPLFAPLDGRTLMTISSPNM